MSYSSLKSANTKSSMLVRRPVVKNSSDSRRLTARKKAQNQKVLPQRPTIWASVQICIRSSHPQTTEVERGQVLNQKLEWTNFLDLITTMAVARSTAIDLRHKKTYSFLLIGLDAKSIPDYNIYPRYTLPTQRNPYTLALTSFLTAHGNDWHWLCAFYMCHTVPPPIDLSEEKKQTHFMTWDIASIRSGTAFLPSGYCDFLRKTLLYNDQSDTDWS